MQNADVRLIWGGKNFYGKYLLFIYIYIFLFITYFLGVIIYFHFSGVLVPWILNPLACFEWPLNNCVIITVINILFIIRKIFLEYLNSCNTTSASYHAGLDEDLEYGNIVDLGSGSLPVMDYILMFTNRNNGRDPS